MALLGRFALSPPSRENGLAGSAAADPSLPSTPVSHDLLQADEGAGQRLFQRKILDAKVRLHRRLIEEINLSAVEKVPESELRKLVSGLVSEYVLAERLPVNAEEFSLLVDELLDEMTGLGPLEPLLKDPTIADILINTHEHVFVERAGQLERVPVLFRDEAHLLRIVNKIVAGVGRRGGRPH
jgi:pilus assembly protein CpaF